MRGLVFLFVELTYFVSSCISRFIKFYYLFLFSYFKAVNIWF